MYTDVFKLRFTVYRVIVVVLLAIGSHSVFAGPLHIAAQNASLERVIELVNSSELSALNELDENGRTPLWYAVVARRHEIVNLLLLRYDADTNLHDLHLRNAPLFAALIVHDVPMVRLLLSRGAVLSDNIKDYISTRRFIVGCIRERSLAMLQFLYELGVRVCEADNATLLGYSLVPNRLANQEDTRASNTEMLHFLLHRMRARPNMCLQNGDTPLLHAVRNNGPSLVLVLMTAGADHTRLNPAGESPLQVAVARNDLRPCFRAVLEHGLSDDTFTGLGPCYRKAAFFGLAPRLPLRAFTRTNVEERNVMNNMVYPRFRSSIFNMMQTIFMANARNARPDTELPFLPAEILLNILNYAVVNDMPLPADGQGMIVHAGQRWSSRRVNAFLTVLLSYGLIKKGPSK